jgi:DNA-binding transcriptional MocR family regulator
MFTPKLQQQPLSVTREMAAALPKLAALAKAKGLQLHHLGAGYPHPEVTDPSPYIAQKEAYFQHLAQDSSKSAVLQPLYSYTDTQGAASVREHFARVYGNDFNATLDPEQLIPTIGSTGGINLLCSLFERTGEKVAYITDAPTYAGFLARAGLYQKARIYSVEMDEQGPDCEALARQIQQARADGYDVAFYYTVPDGHNPGGILRRKMCAHGLLSRWHPRIVCTCLPPQRLACRDRAWVSFIPRPKCSWQEDSRCH